MFYRAAYRFPTTLHRTRRSPPARYLHQVTADFQNYDSKGNLVTKRVPVIAGDPGETYLLVYPEVGSAFRAAAKKEHISAPVADVIPTCKLMFFHESQHFGFESPSYPRLYAPTYISRQTESSISPATLFLDGKMHEFVLDGTADAQFAYHASASAQNLKHVLEQLKDV
ncbi:hypothetical protein BO79DRAFT_276597 [Aspergillus costaricaensis CBS 115574]|uniref:Uncharacterized protein n=1 Tax=Aspergillus costaricaensis CBS 115574 TaxID=1448317 RepID=A0ACD1I0S3_9EURO|nr:hypothetical protein BO79DRAFT_276597 [Aspergillus costaricaensis CBS 115574]RAK83819.1 hypothetical protein BO79DRAFT_276597 [Aspergillus costaricaensis CBS 115574]